MVHVMPAKPLTPEQKDDASRLKEAFRAWQNAKRDAGAPVSQMEAAHRLGFGQSALSQYVNGQIPLNGPPNRSYTLNDGSKVLQYSRSSQMVLPGAQTMQPVTTNTTGNVTMNQGMRQTTGIYNSTSTTYVPQQGPNTTVQLECTVNFTIDATGIVRSWSANGNHCVAN